MRARLMPILLLAALGGCSLFSSQQKFTVYFEPYSAKLGLQSLETIQAAGRYAQDHPWLPVAVIGYAAPADREHDADGLSAQRADVVKEVLVGDGLGATRIVIKANGVTDPGRAPGLEMRRVDIEVGQEATIAAR